MSQQDGVPAERFSHYASYTGTAPNDANDANELSSEEKTAQDVNQWISSQGSEVHACPVCVVASTCSVKLFTGPNITERRPTLRNVCAAVRH